MLLVQQGGSSPGYQVSVSSRLSPRRVRPGGCYSLMQAWHATSGARKRGLGLLLPLGLANESAPAAQREAISADEAVLSATSSALIPRETTDMVVKYIFAQAQSAGASHRFCGEMEQVVRKLSADHGVQRSILEAWEKEERLKSIRDLASSERRARQLNMSAKETLLLVDDEEGKEDEAWACIDASMEVPTREKATSARPMMEGREISPEDMREVTTTFRCGICLDMANRATMIDCPGTHIFCRKCIAKLPARHDCWTSIFSWGRTWLWGGSESGREQHSPRCCPLCRGTFQQWFRVRMLDEAIAYVRSVSGMTSDEAEDDFPEHDAGAKDEGLSPTIIGMVTLAVVVAFVLLKP